MFILDEKTNFGVHVEDDAYDLMFDHRLRLPKPKDVQCYTVGENNRKIPNVKHSESIRHVFRECFHQMIENLRKDMVQDFDRYNDGTAKITDMKTGNRNLKRSVHIGFWKLLVRMYCKKADLTVEDLAHLSIEDNEAFTFEILAAEIKERPQQQNPPLQISKAQLERDLT